MNVACQVMVVVMVMHFFVLAMYDAMSNKSIIGGLNTVFILMYQATAASKLVLLCLMCHRVDADILLSVALASSQWADTTPSGTTDVSIQLCSAHNH